jgi:hypothetical protein
VLESHRNWGLVGVGGVIWVGSYIAGLAAAGSDPENGSGKMAIPLLGPWLALGGRQFACELDLTLESAQRCQAEAIQETTIVATYAALGVVQILGATLVFTGIFDRKESWVRADLVSRPRPGTFSVEPVLGMERAGVKFGLTF